MNGDIHKSTPVSLYQPSDAVIELTRAVKKDYATGDEILNRPWVEMNNYSIIERTNKDQRTFNALVDETTEDPAEAWKWRGTRSTARKKAFAMHANLTSNYIIPSIIAQNEFDEEDREMADVMRTIVEWMAVNSNYQPSFLLTALGMLVNPVTYLGADYAEVFQTIKTKMADGKKSTKEVVDEVLSGFQANVYGPSQVLITNAFVQPIQRQRAIIKRRYIEYEEAAAKYKDHPNWGFVQQGIKSIYNDDNGLFYDIKDEEHLTLIEEDTYMTRRSDLEVCFINGIYMGDDDTEMNAMKHRDCRGAPKYDVIPFGYHRINEHFFYYKSMMFEVGWDDQLIDAQYELIMNRGLLDVNMPVAVSGVDTDKVTSDMVFPSAVVAFQNENAKVTPLLPPSNMSQGIALMNEVEKSMSEYGVSDILSGNMPAASTKAYAVSAAMNAAKVLIAAVGKSLAISMTEYGGLMVDIAVNHVTVPEVDELLGSGMAKLRYHSFIVHNKTENGRLVSKKIRFDESLIGATMDENAKDTKNLELLAESGYPAQKSALIVVNPELFARMKYLVRVDPSDMFAKNEEFQQALMSNLYGQLRMDPLVEPEALVRKLLYSYFRGDADELMAKAKTDMASVLGGSDNSQNTTQPLEPNASPLGAQGQQKALSTAMGGMTPGR